MDSIAVSGIGTSILKVTLFLDVPHTFAGDLDITLTSPNGTVVTVTTDKGLGYDNVYAGTLFDPSETDTFSDHVYTNNVLATPLSPAGAFDNFVGLDPNGSWTLTVADDATGDSGTLVRWDINITTCRFPGTPFSSYCFGDGSAGAACPCGPSLPGRGCPNSTNPNGTALIGSGTASVSADTAVLTGLGMPPGSPVLYFQGTTRVASVFGDGLRCVGGMTVRLGIKFNDGVGMSSYPSGSPSMSVQGMVAPGDTRSYQAQYRDAAPFCTPATFNLTNGVQVTWGS
jgi:hypothetical protein